MELPKSYKEVQKLAGCLAALNRFISKSGERNFSFFKNLRRMSQERFTLDEESNKAFAKLKEYRGSSQLLSRPELGEILLLYLTISDVAVSNVLIREEEGAQRPIYYVSHVLRGAEERYPVIDKSCFCPYHIHGARNNKGAGAGVLTTGPQGITMEYALRVEFPATNKYAKYEAMIVGLKLVKSLNITKVVVKGDSKLVIDHIQGKCRVKNEVLKRYHSKAISLAQGFAKVLAEEHERWCGSHIRARSLAIKITRAGYYWPTLVKDAMSYVKRCNACQRLGNALQQPACTLTPVVSPISFAMWGIDFVGKSPKAKGGVEFAIVVVDYFSKWEEAVPLKKTTGEEVTHFLWKNILTRSEIPKILVSDNGPQFEG
ncbi:hypothetical protein LIER_14861 [Lithospermum erythrorhizon]|uniref:Integrase catalytic domain-containing protein n=1 Tax=Lithospermum erythrorhizon TaxID=34254 RepID=A0AAV3Q2X1_LITER